MRFDIIPQRTIYQLNPLVEVVCELHFQELVSEDDRRAFLQAVSHSYPEGAPQEQSREYLLNHDSSRSWAVSYGPHFLALTATNYRRWENFRARLLELVDALPNSARSTIEGVSLKYADIIIPARLGIPAPPSWETLLAPELLGWLPSSCAPILGTRATTLFQTPEGDVLSLMHGLMRDEATQEFGYIIESLFIRQRVISAEQLCETLDQFNRYSRCVFHACTTPALRDAMSPEVVMEES